MTFIMKAADQLGWMTVIAWQALAASVAFIIGTLLQSLVILDDPDYAYTSWQGTLIVWAVIAFSMLINTVARSLLPKLEGIILVIHIIGCFGVFVPLLVLSEQKSSLDVWLTFNNGGGWSSQGLSTMIGILLSVFLFTGVDGAVHVIPKRQFC